MVTLMCALVGASDRVIAVDIDRNLLVAHLKAAIKVQLSVSIQCDASQLRLFLAKKGKRWLKAEDPEVRALEAGRSSTEIDSMISVEPLRDTWSIDDVLVAHKMTNDKAPTLMQIHVLVVAPAPQKRLRVWDSRPLKAQVYDQNAVYFTLAMDGMRKHCGTQKLYCRPQFHEQFAFMRDAVLTEGHVGWILGPPGVGKSVAAMAFAQTLSRDEWVVTWIRVFDWAFWQCVRLDGDECKTRTVEVDDIDQLLESGDGARNHLVLVDGWTADSDCNQLTKLCTKWFLAPERDGKLRRLAMICSTTVRGKICEDLDDLTSAMEFEVYSWTLDEYLSAVEDAEFYASIEGFLDAPPGIPGEAMKPAEKVEAKYHYAGGSCRYMFQRHTAQVQAQLTAALMSMDLAAGPRSDSSTNRLYALFKDPEGGGTISPHISRYVATRLGVEGDLDVLKQLISGSRNCHVQL